MSDERGLTTPGSDASQPPESLKRFFTALRFILEEVYHDIVLIGFILLTGLTIYTLVHEKMRPTTPPQIPVHEERVTPSVRYIFL